MKSPQTLALTLGIACAQALFSSGIAAGQLTEMSPHPWTNTVAQADQNYRIQDDFEALDFDEEDDLETTEEGFQAIYVNQRGGVLGTFVTVPGARIKVYASGQIEIDKRDYTTEITYYNDGRIRTLGNAQFTYYTDGRIRTIDNTRFRYFGTGRLQSIDNIDFRYYNSGRLQSIDDVSFDYEPIGEIRSISSAETRRGIRIVVVD